ncbi:MAG: hypothetical protein QNJ97_22215 [Myxococcota bacterium]|nr:hypothetical protein [Myxococcota bacterium]
MAHIAPGWAAKTVFCSLALIPLSAVADADDRPPKETADYFFAVRQELARLDVACQCDDAGRTCHCPRTLGNGGDGGGRPLELTVQTSRSTRTVYLCINRFIVLQHGDGPSVELARKLLALNREMVTAKFEWDPGTQAIRLSATINTDSNFDRRAFRSQLQGLWRLAERLQPILARLAGH